MSLGHGFRPIWPFRFAVNWQAKCGAVPIGPVRQFQRDAINDLPPEANVDIGPQIEGALSYGADEPYRTAPVYDYEMVEIGSRRWAA